MINLIESIVAGMVKATTKEEKQAKLKEYRKEASRLASMANKRIQRLEKNDLKDSPAYKSYIENGGKFSVKGKSHNELQHEVARLRKFINAETSTIKGVTKTLKDMASNTGIKYSNLNDLKSKAAKFFELASKVEQYLRTVDDIASAIGYQKIWETINQYTKIGELDLKGTEQDIDSLVKVVTDAIKESTKPSEKVKTGKWFKLD